MRFASSLRKRRDGRKHRGPSGDPVVDENDGLAAHVHGRSIPAIGPLAPLQLPEFLGRDLFDDLFRHAQRIYDLTIQDAHAAGRDRADGEFRLAG